MKPYYEHNGITIWLGDCREILPTIGSVDLVLTDPPYGIDVCTKGGLKSRGHRPYDRNCPAHIWSSVVGDEKPFDPSHLLGFPRIILWGANYYASRLPDSYCWFVWDKKTERGAKSSITDCELAWTKGLSYKTTRIFRHMWAGFQRDSEIGHVHLHPTQKPIVLMLWCLSFFPRASSIIDPYCGSGPTLVAAKQLGKKAIGIEIEEKYAEIAAKRLEQEMLPLHPSTQLTFDQISLLEKS